MPADRDEIKKAKRDQNNWRQENSGETRAPLSNLLAAEFKRRSQFQNSDIGASSEAESGMPAKFPQMLIFLNIKDLSCFVTLPVSMGISRFR